MENMDRPISVDDLATLFGETAARIDRMIQSVETMRHTIEDGSRKRRNAAVRRTASTLSSRASSGGMGFAEIDPRTMELRHPDPRPSRFHTAFNQGTGEREIIGRYR